jgi:putative cardiolipin synthase
MTPGTADAGAASAAAGVAVAPIRATSRGLALLLTLLLSIGLGGCAALPRDVERHPSQAVAASTDTALGRIAHDAAPAGARLSGFRLMPGPVQAFAARLALVRQAQRALDVQYYAIHDDETGRLLLRALRDAALRGVRVRLLVDDLYTAGTDPLLLGLAAHANVEVRLFNPFPLGRNSLGARLIASLLDFGRVNHRMHNKLLVADGAMAVAGGRNIGNEYFLAHEEANFIDLDVFAAGPVVAQLGQLFDLYWNSEHVYPLHTIVPPDEPADELQQRFERRSAVPDGAGPLPPSPDSRDTLGQGNISDELAAGRVELIWAEAEAFADSPDKVIRHRRSWLPGAERAEPTVRNGLMRELLLARREVLLSSPYFVPNADVMDDIREGRLWGLSITILTNSLASTDEPLVHAGYQRYRHQLLDLGVELYEVVPNQVRRARRIPFARSLGRLHAKAAAVDGQLMFIGSLNFDPRSDKHNTELGLLIRSPQLTRQLVQLAELVKTEAAYRVHYNRTARRIEWRYHDDDGRAVTLTEEPDTSWLQRVLLQLVAPLVPEDHL